MGWKGPEGVAADIGGVDRCHPLGGFGDLVIGGPVGAAGAEGRRSIRDRRNIGQIRHCFCLITHAEEGSDMGSDLGWIIFIEPRKQVRSFTADGQAKAVFLGNCLDGFLHVGLTLLNHQYFFTGG